MQEYLAQQRFQPRYCSSSSDYHIIIAGRTWAC